MEEETVTITKKEYEALMQKARLLNALQSNGVDNWEWYDDAYREAFPEEDEDN